MKSKIGSIIIISISFIIMVFLIVFGLTRKHEEEIYIPAYIYPRIEMKVNDYTLYIRLDNNTSANEFYKKVKENETLTITFSDYGGFEKVGDLGFDLTTNDTTIKTEINDVMLYQGNKIVLFYGQNTYSYTRLGKIINNTGVDLKTILSGDNITITLKLESLNILFGLE